MTLAELKGQMTAAVKAFQETGDMTAIQAASKAMDKATAEVAKETATKLQAEAEQLAGAREKLASAIHGQVKALGIDKLITDVKGWGFVYKIDKANPAELDVVYKTVSLTTAVIKARKAGGTGGGAGKSKDEYGLSLSEIVAKFATPEELAAISAEGISNSKSWQLKVAVKKAAIAAGKLAPAK